MINKGTPERDSSSLDVEDGAGGECFKIGV